MKNGDIIYLIDDDCDSVNSVVFDRPYGYVGTREVVEWLHINDVVMIIDHKKVHGDIKVVTPRGKIGYVWAKKFDVL